MPASLPFVVECREPGKSHFEPIAAFDIRRAAESYVADCADMALRRFQAREYRVTREPDAAAAVDKILEILEHSNDHHDATLADIAAALQANGFRVPAFE